MEQKNSGLTAQERSVKIKRQRYATRKIREYAIEKGIELPLRAIAEPCRLDMALDKTHRGGMYVYSILSADEKLVLCWDMVQAEDDPNSSLVRVRGQKNVFVLPNDGKTPEEGGNVFSELSAIDHMRRGLKKTVINMDYPFRISRASYILETMPMFEAQQKRAEELEGYAYFEKGLDLIDGVKPKIATYNGKMVWSLRCSVVGKPNEIVFAITDRNSSFYDVVDNCTPWILQQRVAVRKIRSFIISEGFYGNDAKAREYVKKLPMTPLLGEYGEETVWAWYHPKRENFVICPVKGSDCQEIPYRALSVSKGYSDKQKENQTFEVLVGDHHFTATNWLEFEIASPEEDGAED